MTVENDDGFFLVMMGFFLMMMRGKHAYSAHTITVRTDSYRR